MTTDTFTRLLIAGGIAQLGILVASAMVPFQLRWRTELSVLSRLHRQMYWTYGGYIVLSIVAFALLSIVYAREMAGGSGLARGVCAYIAVFWGVRVVLQFVFDVSDRLSTWWLKAGYRILTLFFAALTLIYGLAAFTTRTQ